MDQLQPSLFAGTDAPPLSPTVQAILSHLCGEPCHAYGLVIEWCETRGDCIQTVVCPSCRKEFIVDDDEFAALRRWTDQDGQILACGVRWE
jgi:hypothetical protein